MQVQACTHSLLDNKKTGESGAFGVKNGYALESSQNYTPRATRLAINKSYPFSRDDDPGTPVNDYYAWLSTVFLLLRVFFAIDLLVGCTLLCTAASVVIFFLVSSWFFGLFFLCQFSTTSFNSLYSIIMRTWVRTSTYSYVQTMREYITTTAILSLLIVKGIKQAHTESMYTTHACHHRTLPGLWHPDPTQTWSQSDLSHPNWTSTRQVYN